MHYIKLRLTYLLTLRTGCQQSVVKVTAELENHVTVMEQFYWKSSLEEVEVVERHRQCVLESAGVAVWLQSQ